MFSIALASLAVLSLALALWQFAVALRFPLHARREPQPFLPPVTLLKSLKGSDAETRACLESWLTQDYPARIQVLFAVASAEDPVCALVRELIAQHPQRDAQLHVFPELLGPNAKVSKLAQLEARAEHEILVVSDADVWVPADLLRQIVAPLADPAVGLVNCFYRLATARNWPMRWEALAVNADFWSQVLQSLSLKPMDFALGAVMATTRARLAGIGGFRALADYLADDYQLGHRLAQAGGRIELCPVVVECRSGEMSCGEVWRHQLRWARTIRVCQPASYFFSILSNATLWPLLWVSLRPSAWAALGAAGCLLVRLLTARALERRLGQGKISPASWWLAGVKDLLHVPVWALSFLGRTVTWRGNRFHVQPGGRLVRV